MPAHGAAVHSKMQTVPNRQSGAAWAATAAHCMFGGTTVRSGLPTRLLFFFLWKKAYMPIDVRDLGSVPAR